MDSPAVFLHKVKPKVLRTALAIAMKAKRMVMIYGPPGIGKSSHIHAIAKEYNCKLIDLRISQIDSCDLNGFPNLSGEKADYKPFAMFPLAGDPLPVDENGKEMNGWILFLDEMNAGEIPTTKASYKVALDRQVGMYDLHERCLVVAAGNREEDNALIEESSEAMVSRQIHLELLSDPDYWLMWANGDGLDYRVTGYIERNPMKLNTFNPAVQNAEMTYPCERTWHFVSDMLTHSDGDLDNPAVRALIAGCIGSGPAMDFINWTKVFNDIPTIQEIVASPETANLPDEPGHRFAIAGYISSHATEYNFEALLKYVGRLPVEYQVVMFKYLHPRAPDLILLPCSVNWLAEHGDKIF